MPIAAELNGRKASRRKSNNRVVQVLWFWSDDNPRYAGLFSSEAKAHAFAKRRGYTNPNSYYLNPETVDGQDL